MVAAWMCCQCDFGNRDGQYCGGQLPGGGQIVYEVACGHGRCGMCGDGMEGPQSLLYAQAQYQGYQQQQQHFPQREVHQAAAAPHHHPMSSDRRPPASGSYHPVVQPVCIYKQQPPDFRRFQPPVVEDDEEYWTNLFTKGSHPPREPPPNPAFDQPPLPPPNPPPPQPTPSPLQTYLTSRLKSQSTKPHVITIGEYDKLMSNHPAYTPPVGYLADYAILTASASPNPIQKENHKDRKKREEMMRREESASFGFAQRLWKRHCEAVRVRNPTDEYGGVEGDGGDEMQEGEEVKMELDEEIYLRAQQISRRKRGKEEDVGGRSKKVKGKGREKEREVVVEVPRIARRDKGKGRERGQDYFTETVQGGQTWSFGGLDGGMDVDEGGAEGGGDGRSCYQATVEDGEEEL